jgi:hypothetical protein
MLLGTSFGCGEVRIGVFETAPEALVQVHTVEQPLGSLAFPSGSLLPKNSAS